MLWLGANEIHNEVCHICEGNFCFYEKNVLVEDKKFLGAVLMAINQAKKVSLPDCGCFQLNRSSSLQPFQEAVVALGHTGDETRQRLQRARV